jgi:hypothetical protein
MLIIPAVVSAMVAAAAQDPSATNPFQPDRLPSLFAFDGFPDEADEQQTAEDLVSPSLEFFQQGSMPRGKVGKKPLFDWNRTEFGLWAGFVHFSGDFEADPDYAFTGSVRVPMPALPTQRFGVWAQISALHIDRSLDFDYDQPDGNFYTFAAGFDFLFTRTKNLLLMAQLGGVYATFGDINGVDDGWGVLAGLAGGIRAVWFHPDSNVWFCYNPQIAIDGSDWFVVHSFGLLIEF